MGTSEGSEVRGSADASDILAAVQQIWSTQLGVQVNADTDFFLSGGDSLRGALAVVRLNQRLGTQLTLATLFENSTAAGFAEGAAASLHALSVRREVPAGADLAVSSMQLHRLMRYMRTLSQGRRPYKSVVPVAIEIEGCVSDARIDAAVKYVFSRHQALRTGFHLDAEQLTVSPIVVEDASMTVLPPWTPEPGFPALSRERLVDQCIDALSAEDIPFARPPLARARLMRIDEGRAILVLVIEHLVFDGWSAEVFFDDFVHALNREPGSERTPLPLQYGAWAREQTTALAGEPGQALREFWSATLRGTVPYPPLALPRPLADGGDKLSIVTRQIGADTMRRLRGTAAGVGATPFMAVLAVAAACWTFVDGDEALVHSPAFNRDGPGESGAIGWFAHSVIFRLRPKSNRQWLDMIEATRDTVITALGHQQLPFAEVVRLLQPEHHGAAARPERLYYQYQQQSARSESVQGGIARACELRDRVLWADAGMSVLCYEVGEDLEVNIVVDGTTVSSAFVNRFADAMLAAAGAIASDPCEQASAVLDIVFGAEQVNAER